MCPCDATASGRRSWRSTPRCRAECPDRYLHYQNFVDAIRAGDRTILTCDIEEGHLSASLVHLGNIAYRVKRGVRFDDKTERFVGDPEADKLLTRPYRAPFVIPEKV